MNRRRYTLEFCTELSIDLLFSIRYVHFFPIRLKPRRTTAHLFIRSSELHKAISLCQKAKGDLLSRLMSLFTLDGFAQKQGVQAFPPRTFEFCVNRLKSKERRGKHHLCLSHRKQLHLPTLLGENMSPFSLPERKKQKTHCSRKSETLSKYCARKV